MIFVLTANRFCGHVAAPDKRFGERWIFEFQAIL
jgi:hypothetical protein